MPGADESHSERLEASTQVTNHHWEPLVSGSGLTLLPAALVSSWGSGAEFRLLHAAPVGTWRSYSLTQAELIFWWYSICTIMHWIYHILITNAVKWLKCWSFSKADQHPLNILLLSSTVWLIDRYYYDVCIPRIKNIRSWFIICFKDPTGYILSQILLNSWDVYNTSNHVKLYHSISEFHIILFYGD